MESALLVFFLLVGIFRVARVLNGYCWRISCELFPRWWSPSGKYHKLYKILFHLEGG